MPKVPKIRSLHILGISPERHRDELDFLPADKDKSFLQNDIITLGVQSQDCPKYPNNKFTMSLQYLRQEKCEG